MNSSTEPPIQETEKNVQLIKERTFTNGTKYYYLNI